MSEEYHFEQILWEKPEDAKAYEITLEVRKLGKVFEEIWEVFDDYKGVVRPIRIISSMEVGTITDQLESRIITLEEKTKDLSVQPK